MNTFSQVQSFVPSPQRLVVKILTRDVTRCFDDTFFQTSDRIKALECVFLRFRHALLVWQSSFFIRDWHEGPTTLRDLKTQFTKTATPQVAEILCVPASAPQASAYTTSKQAAIE